ncbi:MAG: M15 family metallopeptidase [Patescibacteria group bacterium]
MSTNQFGLVDLESVNPKIKIDIRYASQDNFTKKKLYSSARCFLQKSTAQKLSDIQNKLEKQGLGLKIWDGYRPLSVQKELWKIMPDERYIANPQTGSDHNRGIAVDLTLVDLQGKDLLLPTEFDNFSPKAHRNCFDLTEEQIKNRKILEDIMVKSGFIPFPTEWWHFADSEGKDLPVLDIDFVALSSSG